jgi:hypothetical protein
VNISPNGVFKTFIDFVYVVACICEGGCTAEVCDIKSFVRNSVDRTYI